MTNHLKNKRTQANISRMKAQDFLWNLTQGITGIGGQSSTASQEKLQESLGRLLDMKISPDAIQELAYVVEHAYKIGRGE